MYKTGTKLDKNGFRYIPLPEPFYPVCWYEPLCSFVQALFPDPRNPARMMYRASMHMRRCENSRRVDMEGGNRVGANGFVEDKVAALQKSALKSAKL